MGTRVGIASAKSQEHVEQKQCVGKKCLFGFFSFHREGELVVVAREVPPPSQLCPRESLSCKMLLHVQKFRSFLNEKHEVLFSETPFH